MNLLTPKAIEIAAMVITQIRGYENCLDDEFEYSFAREQEHIRSKVVDYLLMAKLYPLEAWAEQVLLPLDTAKGIASCSDRHVMIESFLTLVESELDDALFDFMPKYVQNFFDAMLVDQQTREYLDARAV